MNANLIQVGAAMGNVTPLRELPNYNGALCHRGDEDTDLLCHAVVLSDEDTQVALVSCDVTCIDRPLLLRIRDACARKARIPGRQVVVAATHSHASPATGPSFLSGALPDPLYLDLLVDRIVATVLAAKETAQPCFVAAGMTDAPGFELNRRSMRPGGGIAFQRWDGHWPVEGPVDTAMGFLAFEAQDGQPVALVVNYACHNNVCGGGGGTYHRDLFGRAGDCLREDLPSLRATLFLPAPCGNLICGDPKTLHMLSGDDAARRVGQKCAGLVASAYRRAAHRPVSKVRFASRVLEIPDRPLSESTFCHDGCRGTDEAARAFARRRYEPERRAIEDRGYTTCPVEIAALALGDVAAVTNPAELFVEFGLEIRQRSPFRTTIVSELTNGYCGYVPAVRAFGHGGYETHRTVYTSRLIVDAGKIIVQACCELLNAVRS